MLPPLHSYRVWECTTDQLPVPARLPCPTGASALDKKSKKKFEAGSLERMGAQAQKGPRISAAIGLGELLLSRERGGGCVRGGGGGQPSTNPTLNFLWSLQAQLSVEALEGQAS